MSGQVGRNEALALPYLLARGTSRVHRREGEESKLNTSKDPEGTEEDL